MQRSYNFFYAFRYAFNGLLLFFRKDTNGKIELLLALGVIVAGFLLKISSMEWIVLLICISIVLATEMLNTAIEKLCDLVEPNLHPVINQVKDISAAAVLLASVISAIVGIIIFLPKLFSI
ncbi:diacylglycerol kinase family protein [Pollutibacter soli]|uniref:diacylglycerol kinase family protein n=1 Tax=Pollutibacter soli TaxID=3034157 RepID=UPI003013C685